jgi:hypothetical protein
MQPERGLLLRMRFRGTAMSPETALDVLVSAVDDGSRSIKRTQPCEGLWAELAKSLAASQ